MNSRISEFISNHQFNIEDGSINSFDCCSATKYDEVDQLFLANYNYWTLVNNIPLTILNNHLDKQIKQPVKSKINSYYFYTVQIGHQLYLFSRADLDNNEIGRDLLCSFYCQQF